VDRYCLPGFEQHSDGIRFDRQKLIVSEKAAMLGQDRALAAFAKGSRYNNSTGATANQHVADLLALANAPAPGEPTQQQTAPLVLASPPAA